jgi:hypothetical protein
MPADSGALVDLVALWPLGAAVALAVGTVSSSPSHARGARSGRLLLTAALAVSALACLAQTYGFLGYTTSG